ncbi:MAG: RHS repeat-associated core domain-containing protein, partial [Bacteroidota bacterium]
MTIEGISQVNSGNENAYQFNGMEKEDGFEMDISMTFFRTYDPTIARWLQVDPLGEMAQNYNPYNFSFNNPIAYADPLGDFPNPIKKIKNFLARCKVKCANLSKKSKRKRVKRGQKGGRKRKKSSKKSQNSSGRTDTRYTGKWQPLYSWSSSTTGGTAGTLRTRIPELRNQVNLPTTTHNIPNPILDTDNPIRTSVRTIPPIYFSSFGSSLNRWNATVNRG